MIRSPRFVPACRALLGAGLALAVWVTPAAARDTGTVPPGSYTVKINTNVGTAIGIASPTRPPRVLQMSVRFNF